MAELMTALLDLAAVDGGTIPDGARRAAQVSLFDWITCGMAGRGEPVTRILRNQAAAEAGTPDASVFGGGRYPARMAAMVNGTASHAIDFDDTHFAHVGHLSVGIYPAALAIAEARGASAADVVDAFLLGAEAAIRTGVVLGRAHYDRGFHQTSTAGAFGATVAAARLAGLDREALRMALGLCASRASGLKSQFGTMGKPLNAGLSASNGVEAVMLAGRGITACVDGLMGQQGFVATHSDDPQVAVAPVGEWLFPAISYKLHACCHGTHAMIEALLAANVGPEGVQEIRLRVSPRWLSVCNIPQPANGLEVKFSYRWLAALTLLGRDTMRAETYDDTIARDPACAAIAARVTVTADPEVTDMQTKGEIDMEDGSKVALWHDLAERVEPELLVTRLKAKAEALLGEGAARLAPLLGDATKLTAADLGAIVGEAE